MLASEDAGHSTATSRFRSSLQVPLSGMSSSGTVTAISAFCWDAGMARRTALACRLSSAKLHYNQIGRCRWLGVSRPLLTYSSSFCRRRTVSINHHRQPLCLLPKHPGTFARGHAHTRGPGLYTFVSPSRLGRSSRAGLCKLSRPRLAKCCPPRRLVTTSRRRRSAVRRALGNWRHFGIQKSR